MAEHERWVSGGESVEGSVFMNDRCSAVESDGLHCRATANLIQVRIKSPEERNLVLPPFLAIHLCPKHFVWSESMKLELGL